MGFYHDLVHLKKLTDDLSQENKKLIKQVKSDAALIESLNRYIEALEGKAKMQEEVIKELKEHLSGLVPEKKAPLSKNRGGISKNADKPKSASEG